jgi:hypothetical protein
VRRAAGRLLGGGDGLVALRVLRPRLHAFLDDRE